MKLFLVTSDKFTGTAELHYNKHGLLIKIDCSKTEMDEETIIGFKRAVPASIDIMLDKTRNKLGEGTHIIDAEYEVTLEDFKREYPYSRNFHLLDAIWPRMKKEDQVEAYFAAIEYRKYCERNKWYNKKIAASWLGNREFKNDWRKM